MTSPRPATAARGFTLLEVMLAFVLLAAAMGMLLGMLSNGLGQVRQAQGETEATLYAQSLLDQIGRLEPISPLTREGEFDQGRYRYRLDISQVPDPMPPVEGATVAPPTVTVGAPVLFRVALAVSWGQGLPAQRLDFVTLRARAPQPGAPP